MNRDKLIAIVLVVGLVFMMVALVGVVTVTGLVLVMTNEPVQTDTTPIINSTPNEVVTPTNPAPTTTPTTPTEPIVDEEDVEPVCGNDEIEEGETCEADSDCNTNYECSSCECIQKEPEAELLEDIEITKLFFWCPESITGETNLTINQIEFKNTSNEDFSYTDNIKITTTVNDKSYSAITKNNYDFGIKAGKTDKIYRTFLVDPTPNLVVGSASGDEVTVTVLFGDDYYAEYTHTLRGQDYADAFNGDQCR